MTMEANPIGDQMINMTEDEQIMEIPLNDTISKATSKKRKRNISTKIDKHLSKSLSGLSISQGCSKKMKKKNIPSNKVSSKIIHKLNYQPTTSTKNFTSTFVPQYLTEWLDNDEKLKSTRALAQLFNLTYYLKLQQQLWQDYFDLEHNTCLSYGRSEKFAQQRQKTIQYQLIRTDRELQQHLAQLPELTENARTSIDSTFLSTAIETMVKNHQYRLQAQFKHKQAMLKFDADDHRLIAAAYALELTEEQ
ncbi:unnamed protein product, partial [Rotaria sp. Silwood1]